MAPGPAVDAAYDAYAYRPAELAHGYGPRVHLLADPILLALLAQLSQPSCVQPEVSRLVRALYRGLGHAALAAELPRAPVAVATRMAASAPDAIWRGSVVDRQHAAVVVDIARAGTLPAQTLFETLCGLLEPAGVRQDHIYMNRTCDAAGRVTGVEVSGSKIGGGAAGATVLVPDPMGATGGSMGHTMALYRALPGGPPRRMVALNLVVTPEYLAALGRAHPEAVVYAVRLDRGRSAPEALAQPPGTSSAKESGLDARQYIIPGAGGLGEILNNSYV